MEEIQQQHNSRIEAIDLQIAKLQDDKIKSLDTMFSELGKYYQKREKEREDDDKKILSEAQDIIDSEKKEKENNGKGDEKRTINAK